MKAHEGWWKRRASISHYKLELERVKLIFHVQTVTFSYYGSGPTFTPMEISRKYYKTVHTASQVLVSFQTNQASKTVFHYSFTTLMKHWIFFFRCKFTLANDCRDNFKPNLIYKWSDLKLLFYFHMQVLFDVFLDLSKKTLNKYIIFKILIQNTLKF